MTSGGLAIRYARALFEIGLEQANYRKLNDELSGFVELYEQSQELRVVLQTPSIKVEARKKLVRALAGKLSLSKLVTNYLLLLLDKGRQDQLVGIGEAFQKLVDEEDGVARAHITSAHKLTPAQLSKMKTILGKLTGKKVEAEASTDPSLIGGVVTRLEGRVYDGSLKTQLKSLRQAAAKEI